MNVGPREGKPVGDEGVVVGQQSSRRQPGWELGLQGVMALGQILHWQRCRGHLEGEPEWGGATDGVGGLSALNYSVLNAIFTMEKNVCRIWNRIRETQLDNETGEPDSEGSPLPVLTENKASRFGTQSGG